jgi:predicted dehydrogenase
MTSDYVRVGVVGLGHNGMAHARVHRDLPQSRLVAVCDSSPARARAAASELDLERVYTDAGIFTAADIDAISIHTGDDQHAEPFVRAVESGKHVLVEKPLANSVDDVQIMVAAAARAPHLKIQVGYILRFNPVFEALHQRRSQLGEIFYMEGDYVHNLIYQKDQTDQLTGRNWYLDQELPMVGGGSHPLDILRWIKGVPITSVWSYANHMAFPEMSHDDCMVSLYRFADGTVAKVAALYGPRAEMAPYYNLRVYGTRGTVERDQIALARDAADMHPRFEPVPADRTEGHPYTPEIIDWLDAILQDRPPRTPLVDGANSTVAALCAVQSALEGREVNVPVLVLG